MSPPRQDEFFCIGRKCFPSPRNIIPQFPFRGINIIDEESLADVLASDKKLTQKRTYTVGLRVPNSLQSDLSALVRQREVLQFFMHHTTKKLPRTFEGFLRYKNMQNSQKIKIIEEYSRYFQEYSRLTPSTLAQEVKSNGQEINSLSPKAKSGNWLDVTLTAPSSQAFSCGYKFLKQWDAEFGAPRFPQTEYLSSDFNRIGKYMLAVATPDIEMDITPIMKEFERIHARLEKYRKATIPRLQSNIENSAISRFLKERSKVEITLTQAKRGRLMKEMKRKALMMYLYMAWKTHAQYCG